MRKSLIVVASALLFGVGAADVGNPKLGYDDEVYAGLVHPDDLRPRPARRNYPACRPGRGDDRCIQLYERGVRERLARWNQPTGGWNGNVRMARAERRERWRARQHQRAGHRRAAMHHDRRVEQNRVDQRQVRHLRPDRVRVDERPAHSVRIREMQPREDSRIERGGPYERVRGERTGTPGI
jgi:hypothetical protein